MAKMNERTPPVETSCGMCAKALELSLRSRLLSVRWVCSLECKAVMCAISALNGLTLTTGWIVPPGYAAIKVAGIDAY